MFERSEQPRVRQFKPYCLPDSLDDLAGPYQGSVFLPMNLYWADVLTGKVDRTRG